MIFNLITGAAAGIFAGYLASACRGTVSLLILFAAAAAGYLAELKLRKNPLAESIAIALMVFAGTIFIFPYGMDYVPYWGLPAGFILNRMLEKRTSTIAMACAGAAVFIPSMLFVTGSGEFGIAFICGVVSLLLEDIRNDQKRKIAIVSLIILIYSLYPTGNMSSLERVRSVSRAVALGKGLSGAMALTEAKVATTVLAVGENMENTVRKLREFPGMRRVDMVRHYLGLYPVFNGSEISGSYEVVLCNGNGRMCRLASRFVGEKGILIVPEKCVSEIPSSFCYWSEMPNVSGFIVLSRDFAIDCSGETIERKMQQHLTQNSLGSSVPKGVFDALYSGDSDPACGVRKVAGAKRINYTLWFFGLVSGLYLMLRLIVFSRFDKGERRWSAFENTASVMLLFMLLKRAPGTVLTEVLPASLFFALPVLHITGRKWRILQISGAVLCVLSLFQSRFINPAQLLGAVCCGTMWYHLREEKGAVRSWVDSCSICGAAAGVAIYTLMLTVNAPAPFVIGVVLLLRSNALFRSM